MKVDLHTHSTASDGEYTPRELIRLAKARGVETLALTDHDTIDGLPEAMEEGAAQGIDVIPGVELTAKEHPNFHILGYAINRDDPFLKELCAGQKARRERHKFRIAEFLAEHGVIVDLKEVEALAGNGTVGRPHFAQVMVRQGYVQNSREAFDRYLDTEDYRKLKQDRLSAQECIAVIHRAGGKAVLAHPYQLELEDGPLEEQVAAMKAWGLDGIECFYSKHTPQQEAFYLQLAERYGLHVTAGSDFHGERVHPEIEICPKELDIAWLWEEGTK